jgi:hypothetical protein
MKTLTAILSNSRLPPNEKVLRIDYFPDVKNTSTKFLNVFYHNKLIRVKGKDCIPTQFKDYLDSVGIYVLKL